MEYSTEVIAGVYLVGPPAPDYRSLENPQLSLTDPAAWEEVFGWSTSATGESITARKAMMFAPFYHAVQMIAGDVARLRRQVYRRRPDIAEDARERFRGHPLSRLLNLAPNDEVDAVTFWMRLMADVLVWRNGYAVIGRNGLTTPMELFNLLPDRTRQERIDGQLFYITEIDSDRNSRLVPFLPEDIIHIKGPDVRGLNQETVYQLARNTIALGLAQENFASKFFRNGGRVGGVLELPLGMTKPARDTVEEGFRKTYEGSDNPFKTVILRDNAKFHSAQQSPRDSQMVEATANQTRMIAHWFNLSPSKLGLSDSVSYNSKAEDNQDYLDRTLSIWLAKIENQANLKLLSDREEGEVFIEHDTNSLLRMNLTARSESYASAIAARWMNPNEVRAKENMLPYAGGDEFVNPNTMKSGNEPAEGTDEDEPDEPAGEPPEETKTRPDAATLRVLFGITSRARDKAKRPDGISEWITGNLQPHREEWRHLWGDRPFPFEDLAAQLRFAVEHYPEDKLPVVVESICNEWENKTWNAE